ncbi:MAG: N-formylglutamate amidohydrolase [Saprospiraceae bacterium]
MAVQSQLDQYGHALIIDCHSFSEIPFERDLNNKCSRPDIIGTDAFHTSQALQDLTHQFFISQGLSVGLDWPYLNHGVNGLLPANKRVQSILIEVNRKLYLDAGTRTRNLHFNQIKSVLNHYLHLIRSNVNDIFYPINNES